MNTVEPGEPEPQDPNPDFKTASSAPQRGKGAYIHYLPVLKG